MAAGRGRQGKVVADGVVCLGIGQPQCSRMADNQMPACICMIGQLENQAAAAGRSWVAGKAALAGGSTEAGASLCCNLRGSTDTCWGRHGPGKRPAGGVAAPTPVVRHEWPTCRARLWAGQGQSRGSQRLARPGRGLRRRALMTSLEACMVRAPRRSCPHLVAPEPGPQVAPVAEGEDNRAPSGVQRVPHGRVARHRVPVGSIVIAVVIFQQVDACIRAAGTVGDDL